MDPVIASALQEHFGDRLDSDYSVDALAGERDLNFRIISGADEMVL
jgi:hypothetical protein